MHRKVEAVALLEGERARRRVSVDLTVPNLPWPADAAERRLHTVVPLATIAKSDMRQFDATDHTGASLPVLATADNGELSCAFLVALVEAEAGRFVDEVDRQSIKRCVFGHAPASTEEAESLIARYHLEETLSERFLLRLAEEFILFAVLPIGEVSTRRVLKYSYHWSATRTHGAREHLRDLTRRMAAAAGWRPYSLDIELAAPATAASTHLEVQAPAGLHCVDLTLHDDEGNEIVRDTESGSVAHAHTTHDRSAASGSVRFDPDLGGVHRLVTWSAWGVALLLVATRWRLNVVALDPGTPVSLLLFGPALLLTWLVRPGENWIVSAIVGPLRVLALTLAGFLFAVGFGLSVGFDAPPYASRWGHLADIGWMLSIAVSVVSGMVLTIGRILIRHRLKRGA